MKGIILAGGKGTRLHPITLGVSKQLLPVYDCPMIYYPLSVLLRAGIDEILLISTLEDIGGFEKLLGDGSFLGIRITYAVQPEPKGIAQALLIAEPFLEGEGCTLILGDNLFYGDGVEKGLSAAITKGCATIFSYPVKDPQRYGVISYDSFGAPSEITEKPSVPASNRAVTGLYVYPNKAIEIAQSLTPSKRGELEITDINRAFLASGELSVIALSRSDLWLDTGTIESLYQATDYVRALEERIGVKLGCIEEAALHSGFIGVNQMRARAALMPNTPYGAYLSKIVSAHE